MREGKELKAPRHASAAATRDGNLLSRDGNLPYSRQYLNLTNIRLLIRFSATGLLLKILIIIRILLLTSYITALIYLESICL
jgi:hypothetical protein